MRNWKDITEKEQTKLKLKYILPNNKENLFVNIIGQVGEKNNFGFMVLTLKNSYNNFHNYRGKQL